MFFKFHFFLSYLFFVFSIFNFSSAESAEYKNNKYVFAHYMVCCPKGGVNSTVEDYLDDIRLARGAFIDGFALNCGGWDKQQPHYKKRVEMIYEAAKIDGHGFKLFISADGKSQVELGDMISSFRTHPNQFVYNGKPVISTFGGGADGRVLTKIAHENGAFFVPYFHPLPISDNINKSHLLYLEENFPDIDGFFYFRGGGEVGQRNMANRILSDYFKSKGKIFMASIVPYYRGSGVNFRVFDTNGFEGMSDQWVNVINSSVDWVELVTWNDWAESSYISPFERIVSSDFFGGDFGQVILPHDAYLYASRYFISWFKSRAAPNIVSDQVFFFYRIHPSYISVPISPKIVNVFSRPVGVEQVSDLIYFTAFLKEDAFLTVYTGDRQVEIKLNKGFGNYSVPFSLGKQRFVVRRGEAVLSDKWGAFEISKNNVMGRFNYTSGALFN